MMDVAAVGSEDFVLGFRLAGVHRIYSVAPEKMEETIRSVMADETIGIVVVHADEVRPLSPWLRQRMIDSVNPVFITIGSEEGELREKVKRAIGVDLYRTE